MLLKHSLTRTIIQPSFAEVRFISSQGLFNGVRHFSLFDFLSVLTLILFQILAYTKALDDAIAVLDKIAMPVDVNDRKFTWILWFVYMDFMVSSKSKNPANIMFCASQGHELSPLT